jgi:hypothetical protein
MATYEKNGQMTYVDAAGNENLLFPKTKIGCVEGLEAALAGKAPAGYGLGQGDSNYISDCNSAINIGWYSLTSSTLNLPSATFATGTLRVERRGKYIMQTALVYDYEAKRNSSDGGSTWKEWVDSGPSAFAPSGYGLGWISPAIIDDCNSAIACGWYRTSRNTLNQPFEAGEWMRVDSYSADYSHQTWFYDGGNGSVVERFMVGSVWQPWEWVNPPMADGTEYRTTERYQGKAVYAVMVYFGALPNSTAKALTVSKFAGATGVVEMRGMINNNGAYTPADATLGLSQVWANPSGGTIHALTTADLSSQTMRVLLKYTKD